MIRSAAVEEIAEFCISLYIKIVIIVLITARIELRKVLVPSVCGFFCLCVKYPGNR